MQWFTEVETLPSSFKIEPDDRLLFVGSCFADSIGSRFSSKMFKATVNPFGVMYNPISVFHTITKTDCCPDVAIITLGTNHVYRLKETGEIVDNCQKRPQRLFSEEELSIDECADALCQCIDLLTERQPNVNIVLTVSPIRYAKYGFHGSRLSKAVLLLAVDRVCHRYAERVAYFPAYEIMNDQLRDYRFYKTDMLHPNDQAVDYIYERFAAQFFSPQAQQFDCDMAPVLAALAHKPLHPDSDDYKTFLARTRQQMEVMKQKWPFLATY